MQGESKNLLSVLIVISKIDSALAGIKAERKKLENELGASLATIKKEEQERLQKAKIHEDKRARYNKEEKRLRDERDKLVGRRKALTTLNNYKLQQSAEKEIEHASRQISLQEESLLSVLEEVEKLESEIKKLDDSLVGRKASYESGVKEARETAANLEERAAKHISEREELVKQIDTKSLTLYDRVKDKFVMDPVVDIINGTCSGCFMQIGPQILLQINRGDNLQRCPGCGRILYISEKQEEVKSEN